MCVCVCVCVYVVNLFVDKRFLLLIEHESKDPLL